MFAQRPSDTGDIGKRVLFMASGRGQELFERYVSDAGARHLKMDWVALNVYFINGDGELSVVRGRKLTIGEMFAGISQVQHWRKEAQRIAAADTPIAEQLAQERSADLICGPRASTGGGLKPK